ncbi:response regulator transcription factor [Streptomyces niveus]|uniref:response regulator transcription factor n=1 Tax=Streptomyces niveus TaxID=193462 RepID=UPI003418FECC
MRVLIVEDNSLLREGLRLILTGHGHDVDVLDTAETMDAAVAAFRPALLIADVRLPPGYRDEGLRAALAARARDPELTVLVLSSYVETGYAAELLADRRGGVGYLLKDRVSDVPSFLAAVDRVAAGGSAIDPEVVAKLLTSHRAGPLDSLTPRETQVLRLVGQGLSNPGIAAELVITESAVNKHVGNIFAKLGVSDAPSGHRRVRAVLMYLENAN